MEIVIEGKDYNIPSSLLEITLGDRIAYDKMYGRALAEKLKKIREMKDGPIRDMDFTEYHVDLACKTLSFFGKIPLNVIQNTSVAQVLTIYHHQMQVLSDETDFADPNLLMKKEFEFAGARWSLYPPELTEESKITFGEFLDAKQTVQNIYEVGNEKWESLLPLCCIYLRRGEEPYDPKNFGEGSHRYDLMRNLPLQYALYVAFFLKSSMYSFLKTFPSFGQAKQNQAAGI